MSKTERSWPKDISRRNKIGAATAAVQTFYQPKTDKTMGTWGAGIYENDSTRDYIDGIIDNISNAVRDIVKRDYTLLHAGMPQSDLFMCYIDLLNAICSRHDLHTSLPDAEVVRKWKAKYMEVWEFTVGECDPAEDYRKERAIVLNESFDNLIALASKKNKSTKL